jgi:hypothetical protein
MNSQFLGISLLLMVVVLRLHRLLSIESTTLVLIYEHQFYKIGNRLTITESSSRHRSCDPISIIARGARA